MIDLALHIIGIGFASIVILFFMFIIHIALKAAYLRNERTMLTDYIWRITLYFFGAADFLVNAIVFTVIYGFELPNKYQEGWLVTHRIRHHSRRTDGWKGDFAEFCCSHLNNVEQAIRGRNHC